MPLFLQWQTCLLVSLVTILGVNTPVTRTHGLKVPNRELGFVYQPCPDCQPPITWSFYCDNTCPDCKKAFPTVLQVANRLGPRKVKLVFHPFSFPFHRNSHSVVKAAHVIDDYSNGSATYVWFQTVYDRLDSLTNSATAHMDDDQVLATLAGMATEVSGIPRQDFLKQIDQWPVEWRARHGWKYCCTRAVFQTPTFMVNDVLVDADQSWTVDQWIDFMDPLIETEM